MLSRLFFSFMGLPMIFNAMFNFLDIFSYGQMNLIYNNEIIEISDEEKADIQSEIIKYLENAYDSPALAVTFPELYKEMLKDGYFLNFKFDAHYEFNGLPFDEITIKIEDNAYGFNIFRGENGVFQGRCIYINTENSSSDLFNVIKNIVDSKIPYNENEENLEDSKIESASENTELAELEKTERQNLNYEPEQENF